MKKWNFFARILCALTLITFASCNYAGDNSGSNPPETPPAPVECTITFANGGHGTAPSAITEKHKGEVITLPAALTESGWLFKKWTDGTAEYDAGAEYEVTGNVTMTASWEVDNTIAYTLPENGNGGLEGTSTQRQGDVATATWLDSTTGNIKINGTAIAGTFEVVAIPTGTVAKINMTSTDETGDLFTSTRKVKLSPFVMSAYPVTRSLFKAVMGETYFTNLGTQAGTPLGMQPDTNGTPDENPVIYINWFDAIVFCNKLSIKCGLEPVYSYQINGTAVTNPDQWITCLGSVPIDSDEQNYDTWKDGVTIDLTKNGYRLPTEAEWEFCARGGDPNEEDWKYTYSGSNTYSEVAWCTETITVGGTNIVGGMSKANRLGIYDMSGNVWEWCDDYYNSDVTVDDTTDSEGYVKDPLVVSASSSRRLRGGGWRTKPFGCECGSRYNSSPCYRADFSGFRLVRSSN